MVRVNKITESKIGCECGKCINSVWEKERGHNNGHNVERGVTLFYLRVKRNYMIFKCKIKEIFEETDL